MPAGAWVAGVWYRQGYWLPAGTTSYTIREVIHIPEEYRYGPTNKEYMEMRYHYHIPGPDNPTSIKAVRQDMIDLLAVIINNPRDGRYVTSKFLGVAAANMAATGTFNGPNLE